MSAGGQATGDLLTIVDVSEAAAADKNKKITMENLFKGIPGNVSIGTSSGTDKLNISSSTNQIGLDTGDQSTFGTLDIGHFSNGAFIGTQAGSNTQSNVLRFGTGGSERMRIDSSGRLLRGTTSTSANANTVLQGSSGGTTGAARLFLQRGSTPANGQSIANIFFADNSSNEGAKISAIRDAGTWTSGSSHPTRLVFETTADGASSPTERLRIDRDGKISTGGESSPDCNAGGLCLDQNAGDGIILSFKSSDVSHGMTNFDQTDTYFSARKVSGDKGGLRLRSYTDAAGADPALLVQAYINTDTDASYVPITFLGGKKSGAGSANISSNRRILEVKNADGTRIASFTGTGLTFGTDTATANALDDYEDGTYTPTITLGSGSATLNASFDKLGYTKIGRVVHIQGQLVIDSVSSPSGSIEISLPFTTASLTDRADYAHQNIYTVYTGSGAPSSGIYLNRVLLNQSSNGAQIRPVIGFGSEESSPGDYLASGTDIWFVITYFAA